MRFGLSSLLTALAVTLTLACSANAPSSQAPAPAAAARPTQAPATTAAARPEPVQLKISHSMITSSAGNYIATEQGYFREEGIDVEFIPLTGGPETMTMIVSGQSHVGGGLISSGLFNAFARGIPVKIVADHGANLPNASAGGIAFRKDLYDSGATRSPADLRGRKIAITVEGGSAHVTLDRYLQSGGLTLGDVETVMVPFPETLAAFENKAIDASYYQEPWTTIGIDRGMAARGPIAYEIYPNQQIGGIMFGERMTGDQATSLRYMRAYVRGVRDYVKAMQERDAAKFDEVVPILIKYTSVKERSLFERAIPSGLRADPVPNLQSIIDDQEWYLAHGYQTQRIRVEDFVDTSFVEQAVRELGPYR
jgi:NitT/TauT family transport system substrate-binding protein